MFPCYVLKKIFLYFQESHLSETCKLWRNLLHELWLEEQNYRCIIQHHLIPRALAREVTLDLLVEVIEFGTEPEIELLLHIPLFRNTLTSEVNIVEQREKWIVSLCIESKRDDLILRLYQLGHVDPHTFVSNINPISEWRDLQGPRASRRIRLGMNRWKKRMLQGQF